MLMLGLKSQIAISYIPETDDILILQDGKPPHGGRIPLTEFMQQLGLANRLTEKVYEFDLTIV